MVVMSRGKEWEEIAGLIRGIYTYAVHNAQEEEPGYRFIGDDESRVQFPSGFCSIFAGEIMVRDSSGECCAYLRKNGSVAYSTNPTEGLRKIFKNVHFDCTKETGEDYDRS